MTEQRLAVLYIAGSGRCGSTLLSGMLERPGDVFSPGELLNLWERGVLESHPCGCGRAVRDCPVWRDVLQTALPAPADAHAAHMMRLQHEVARTVHLPLLLWRRGGDRLAPALDEYIGHLDALYRSIAERTGAGVIVDASKAPAYGAVLRLVPSIELFVVHLVRDPRAVAHSWARKRELVPGRSGAPVYMHQAGTTESTGLWLRYNAGAELLRQSLPRHRSVRLRYEDFVASPQASLDRISRLVGVPAGAFALDDGGGAALERNHSVSGNPSRFRVGRVELHADDEWRTAMPAHRRRSVMALAWPLAWRYGYR